jgi:DNA-directed RNA polymerase specialized sigma24 family protein
MASLHDLYERHAADVYRFALYLSGNPAEAEDITADTFVRLWTAPGAIRLPTVKAYLSRLRGICIIVWRRDLRCSSCSRPLSRPRSGFR